MLRTGEILLIVATFVVVAIVVIVIGAALEASLATLAMLIGAVAAFLQYRRITGRRPGTG